MATPHGSVPPIERNKTYVRILRARAAKPTRFTSHSTFVTGRFMHWGDEHSELCVNPELACCWCKARYVRLWYGWLFGRDETSNGPALLQLTAGAVETSIILREGTHNLRGATIILTREEDRTGSIVTANVSLHRSADRIKGEEPDTLGLLCRFYKIAFPQLGHDQGEERRAQ